MFMNPHPSGKPAAVSSVRLSVRIFVHDHYSADPVLLKQFLVFLIPGHGGHEPGLHAGHCQGPHGSTRRILSNSILSWIPETTTFREESSKKPRAHQIFFSFADYSRTGRLVNLSPYEKDRIIRRTSGRRIWAVTCCPGLCPQTVDRFNDLSGRRSGKDFWNRVYKKAQEKFGPPMSRSIPLSKVWIIRTGPRSMSTEHGLCHGPPFEGHAGHGLCFDAEKFRQGGFGNR